MVSINAFSQNSIKNVTRAIDDYFEKLESFGLSGSLLIGYKNEILLEKTYGVDDESIKMNYAYDIGSLAKQFTDSSIFVFRTKRTITAIELVRLLKKNHLLNPKSSTYKSFISLVH